MVWYIKLIWHIAACVYGEPLDTKAVWIWRAAPQPDTVYRTSPIEGDTNAGNEVAHKLHMAAGNENTCLVHLIIECF